MSGPTEDEEAPSKEISALLDRLLARAVDDAAKEAADQVEQAPKRSLDTKERRTPVPPIGRTRRKKA